MTEADRHKLYRLVLLQRLFEERAIALYRQGQIPGSFYDGRGQEAVAAAAGAALQSEDVITPVYRDVASYFARGVSAGDVFRNFLGCADGPSGGRDGGTSFGDPSRGIFPPVSMLADVVSVAVGAALEFRRRREPRVALTLLGEGGFSVGDAHEALNLAGVWQVPLVIVLQHNHYSYSTPIERQMVNTSLAERISSGWSIPCSTVDGTDALITFDAVRAAVERARSGEGPQAVEAVTLRINGHGAHDDGRYMSSGIRAAFADRDPVARLEARLALDGLPASDIDRIRQELGAALERELDDARHARRPDPATLQSGVWAENECNPDLSA